MSIWTKWLLEALPSLQDSGSPAVLSKVRKGPQEQLGEGVRLQGWAQKDSLSPGRGRQLEDSVRLPDWPARSEQLREFLWSLPPLHSVCSRRCRARGSSPPSGFQATRPKTISSVRLERPSEGKADDTWWQVCGWGGRRASSGFWNPSSVLLAGDLHTLSD